MKKLIKLLLFISISINAFSQSNIDLRGDSIRIYKQGGFAELVIRNRTKDTIGVLWNTGNGITKFRSLQDLGIGGNSTNAVQGKGNGALNRIAIWLNDSVITSNSSVLWEPSSSSFVLNNLRLRSVDFASSIYFTNATTQGGASNTTLGWGAGGTSGNDNNTLIGFNAGHNATNLAVVTAIGSDVLSAVTSATSIIAIGQHNLYQSGTAYGSDIISIGNNVALTANSSSRNITLVSSGITLASTHNFVGIGSQIAVASTGGHNYSTFVGDSSGSTSVTGDTYVESILIGFNNGKTTGLSTMTNNIIIGQRIKTDRNNLAIFGNSNQLIRLGNTGGNTTTMNAFSSPQAGDIFYNSDSLGYCMYNGSAWIKWAAPTGVSGAYLPLTWGADQTITGNTSADLIANLVDEFQWNSGSSLATNNPHFGFNPIQLKFGYNTTDYFEGLFVHTTTNWSGNSNLFFLGSPNGTDPLEIGFKSDSIFFGKGVNGPFSGGSPLTIGIGGASRFNVNQFTFFNYNQSSLDTTNNKLLVLNTSTGKMSLSYWQVPGAGGSLPNSYPKNALHARNDSTIVWGGTIDSITVIDGANTYPVTFNNFQAATGRGFRVNFGSDAGWDMIVRDSATGFWTRVAKGTVGQVFTMLGSGGVGWANATGGGSGITDPGGSNDDILQRKSGAWTNRTIAQVKTDMGLYTKTQQTLTDGATITWTMSSGNNATVTLGGNRTLAISGAVSGDYGTLKVVQDGTGTRTLTLPAGSKVVNGGGGAITLSVAANAIDIISFYYDGTNYFWYYGIAFT